MRRCLRTGFVRISDGFTAGTDSKAIPITDAASSPPRQAWASLDCVPGTWIGSSPIGGVREDAEYVRQLARTTRMQPRRRATTT
jgi:hypothetical protein